MYRKKKLNGENQFVNSNFTDNVLNGKKNKDINEQSLKEGKSNRQSIDDLLSNNLNNGDISPTNTNKNSEEFKFNFKNDKLYLWLS